MKKVLCIICVTVWCSSAMADIECPRSTTTTKKCCPTTTIECTTSTVEPTTSTVEPSTTTVEPSTTTIEETTTTSVEETTSSTTTIVTSTSSTSYPPTTTIYLPPTTTVRPTTTVKPTTTTSRPTTTSTACPTTTVCPTTTTTCIDTSCIEGSTWIYRWMGYERCRLHFENGVISVVSGKKIPALGLVATKDWYDCDSATIHEIGLFWDSWLLSTFNCEEGTGKALKLGGFLWLYNVDGELYCLPIPTFVVFKLERVESEDDCR